VRLEFSFSPTKGDLRWLVARTSRNTIVSLLQVGGVLAALAVVALVVGQVFGGLVLVCFAALFLLTGGTLVRHTAAKLPPIMLFPQTFEIDDSGIRNTTRMSTIWYAWDMFDRLVTDRNGWLLFAGQTKAMTILRVAVPAEHVADVERFLARVGRPAPVAQTPLPSEPPSPPVTAQPPSTPSTLRPAAPISDGAP
jgi:hypothetical protein